MKSFEKEYRDYKKEFEKKLDLIKAEKHSEVIRIKTFIEKYGIYICSIDIDGKDMFAFASANPNINGEQIFRVYNKKNGQYFLAYYYSTENSFVDIFDENKWFFPDLDWENRLNDFTAKPVFLLFK
jgi:hypothetical protein